MFEKNSIFEFFSNISKFDEVRCKVEAICKPNQKKTVTVTLKRTTHLPASQISSMSSTVAPVRSFKKEMSVEDARLNRHRNTVELRKNKTQEKLKKLRNLSDSTEPETRTTVLDVSFSFLGPLGGQIPLLIFKLIISFSFFGRFREFRFFETRSSVWMKMSNKRQQESLDNFSRLVPFFLSKFEWNLFSNILNVPK